MYYVYVMREPNTKFCYIGFTKNLERRMSEHKSNKPNHILVYYEAYFSELEHLMDS